MSTMDRREFIEVLGGGLTVAFAVDVTALLPQQRGRGYPSDFNAYLRVGEDGRVTLFTGKIEMGQGVNTSLCQMLADELDVPLGVVEPVMGDTDLCPWDMGTFGSMTTRFFGPPLRAAGAEARAVLMQLASEQWKVPVDRLATKDGAVYDTRQPTRRVAYGDLTKGRKIDRHVDGVKPEPRAEHTVCGVATPRMDAVSKVTGGAKYAGDIRLPGMLCAALLRPPSHESKLVDADVRGAEAVAGVTVVRDGDFIAVLHEHPDVARDAVERIRARWDTPKPAVDNSDLFDHLEANAPDAQVVSQAGDLAEGKRLSVKTASSRYLNQYVAHAPIEPHTAVAEYKDGRMTIWASTQGPFGVQSEVARALNLPPAAVRVITPYVGGGFGGKNANGQAVEAARVAMLSRKPVQLAWSRKEEFFYDRFRPAAVVHVTSGVDAKGKLVLWQLETLYAGDGASEPMYAAPHHRVTSRGGWMRQGQGQPLAVGPWRAPAANTNRFAAESQIDMMAAAAGVDPVSFRLANLKDERARRVLRAAAERFGGSFAPGPSGKGIGVAMSDDVGTCVATIAQVSVNQDRGTVQVQRMVCVQDMGEVINPEGAKLQVESCLTMGLGYALREEIRFQGGAVLDENFDSYQLPRFSWVPKIEVVLLDSDLTPQGGGEPAIPTVGAVVANAIFDACGARLYELPMTPGRIRTALLAGGAE
ncbi:MAG TPA: molybdopterin cofactor-binding domain-containing protein [Longimicrobiales bacterium]|nr:molybdopterin cofactor-binding domain-containing protein [Longimicrobiales bacterium]